MLYLHLQNKARMADDVTRSKTLHGIFEPIFREIDKLVKEQVNLVRIKRMKDHHPKGFDIKVSASGQSADFELC